MSDYVFIDGGPPLGLPPATALSLNDLIVVAQNGTPGVAATATDRAATLSQLFGGGSLGPWLPTVGGTLDGPGNLVVNGTLGVASTIQIGRSVAAGGTATIITPNGSHINLLPQGTGRVRIGSGIAPLDVGPINMASTFNGTTHASGVTNGFLQALAISGTNSTVGLSSINQWNVASDTLAKTGQALFHSGIWYNFGGGAFAGNRGGLIINMTQTGAISGSSLAGGIEALHVGVTTNNTYGGTNPGPGAAGAIFTGNFYTRMQSGSVNLQGTCGIEIDVEANTGAIYQSAAGLSVVATAGHTQAPIVSTIAYGVFGQTGSIGFEVGYAVGNWGLRSGSTLLRADWAADTTAFPMARGFDLRSITFSGDVLAAAGTSITSTGAVRVGTGYLEATATGASLHVDGAVVTAGTLTGAVTTAYPFDGNHYWVDDPYGGIWAVSSVSGSTSITAIALVTPGYVQGAPPANPVTLTPRGPLKKFSPGAITANLTWDSTRTALAIQPAAGGKLGFYGATPLAKQTGVAVTAAGVHAALTAMGLIAP